MFEKFKAALGRRTRVPAPEPAPVVSVRLPDPPGSTLTPAERTDLDARHEHLAWPLREHLSPDPDLYDDVLTEALAPGSIADEAAEYLTGGAR